ncbi:GNAT family N-acetyltransferase [Chloroflexia bacterium SDU3-3]|nr:GNAT family N-acetyltransferase [Chloroflexia bacterium SDU3-3]
MHHQITPLSFRPAREGDREAVFAMVATVWGGTDYIPSIWDAWLHAEDGPMLVGTLGDERPVALCKLTGLTPAEDWLEGVRVDPAFRGQGFARAMIRHAIAAARERGKRTLRYQTDESNTTMHRLAEELGFTLSNRPRWWVGAPVLGEPAFRPLGPERLPQLLAEIAASPLLRQTSGLFSVSWTAYELTEQQLRQRLAAGQVVGIPGDEAWAIVTTSRVGGCWVGYAAGPHAQLVRLLAEVRRSPNPDEPEMYVRAHFPAGAAVLDALAEAGFQPGEHNARVYTYQLGE